MNRSKKDGVSYKKVASAAKKAMKGNTKKYKDPKTPNIGSKSVISRPKKIGTKRTMSGVVGGPVKAGARKGGVLRAQRSRQK